MLTKETKRKQWRTTLTLKPELADKLEALADENGINPNAMIAQLIAHAPEPKKPKAKTD